MRIDFDDFERPIVVLLVEKVAKYRPARRFFSRFPLSPTGCSTAVDPVVPFSQPNLADSTKLTALRQKRFSQQYYSSQRASEASESVSPRTPHGMILSTHTMFMNLTRYLNYSVMQIFENRRASESGKYYDVVAKHAPQIKSRHKKHHGRRRYSDGTRNGISIPYHRFINLHFPA
jgi:hypothetical protein